jgi:hypothetical protein
VTAAFDRELKAGPVFGRTATFFEQERPANLLNVDSTILDRLSGLKQLAGGLFRIGKWSVGGELHRLGFHGQGGRAATFEARSTRFSFAFISVGS